MTASRNLVIGYHAALDWRDASDCVVLGPRVPAPTVDGTIRIGTGETYLEIVDGKARVVGASPDATVVAVLQGLAHAGDTIREMIGTAGEVGRPVEGVQCYLALNGPLDNTGFGVAAGDVCAGVDLRNTLSAELDERQLLERRAPHGSGFAIALVASIALAVSIWALI